MPRNSRLTKPLFALLTALAALSGCADADYLNHRDTVALAAGDSVNANLTMETTDPWLRASNNTSGLGSDAGRASAYLKEHASSGSSGQSAPMSGPSSGSVNGP